MTEEPDRGQAGSDKSSWGGEGDGHGWWQVSTQVERQLWIEQGEGSVQLNEGFHVAHDHGKECAYVLVDGKLALVALGCAFVSWWAGFVLLDFGCDVSEDVIHGCTIANHCGNGG